MLVSVDRCVEEEKQKKKKRWKEMMMRAADTTDDSHDSDEEEEIKVQAVTRNRKRGRGRSGAVKSDINTPLSVKIETVMKDIDKDWWKNVPASMFYALCVTFIFLALLGFMVHIYRESREIRERNLHLKESWTRAWLEICNKLDSASPSGGYHRDVVNCERAERMSNMNVWEVTFEETIAHVLLHDLNPLRVIGCNVESSYCYLVLANFLQTVFSSMFSFVFWMVLGAVLYIYFISSVPLKKHRLHQQFKKEKNDEASKFQKDKSQQQQQQHHFIDFSIGNPSFNHNHNHNHKSGV